ncbi:hypothetical protein PV518_31375 [Streptomyces sp. ND04-05B]|uniref:hypothetical protein n=1 Tax=Streptomyces sp. ND04-05B TaxID=3028693 RepID=UPI0029A503E2|nr:hypothetical protein [Streptomyces sp. ND04-05B]MDX3066629.1 hypothetical protein [Streptomyces sp. ND04-05B]
MRNLNYDSHPMLMPQMENKVSNLSEFLVFPVSQARKSGYKANITRVKNSGSQWSRLATHTQLKILNGKLREYKGKAVPKGGCSAFASRALRKGTASHLSFRIGGTSITYDASATPDGIIDSVISVMRYSTTMESQSDARVENVTKHWSICMQKAGFHYPSPRAAVNDTRWAKGDEPKRLEVAVAVADMECKKETHYLDTVVQVQSNHERKIIAEQSATLSSLQKDLKIWLANAKEVVNK